MSQTQSSRKLMLPRKKLPPNNLLRPRPPPRHSPNNQPTTKWVMAFPHVIFTNSVLTQDGGTIQ